MNIYFCFNCICWRATIRPRIFCCSSLNKKMTICFIYSFFYHYTYTPARRVKPDFLKYINKKSELILSFNPLFHLTNWKCKFFYLKGITLLLWYQITSNGGTGLNFDTQVRLMVDPQSTCISAPPKISVCGSTSKLMMS